MNNNTIHTQERNKRKSKPNNARKPVEKFTIHLCIGSSDGVHWKPSLSLTNRCGILKTMLNKTVKYYYSGYSNCSKRSSLVRSDDAVETIKCHGNYNKELTNMVMKRTVMMMLQYQSRLGGNLTWCSIDKYIVILKKEKCQWLYHEENWCFQDEACVVYLPILHFNLQLTPSEVDLYSTGRERLIRSHSSARFCFELSGNSN